MYGHYVMSSLYLNFFFAFFRIQVNYILQRDGLTENILAKFCKINTVKVKVMLEFIQQTILC